MKGSWKRYVARNNHHTEKVTLLFFSFLFLLLFPSTVKAVLQKCTICHSKPDFKTIDNSGKVIPLFVDEKMVKKSVHAKKDCTDCHADVVEIPHRTPPKRVNCIRCHYAGNPEGAPQEINYDAYKLSVHGKALAAGNPKAPIARSATALTTSDHIVILQPTSIASTSPRTAENVMQRSTQNTWIVFTVRLCIKKRIWMLRYVMTAMGKSTASKPPRI